MKKLLISILMILLLMAGCSQKDDDSSQPDETDDITVVDSFPISVQSPENIDLDLRLDVNSNDESELIAKVTNRSDVNLKTVKINVDFLDENVSRVLYLSQELAPNETSLEFLITGPNSNKTEDVKVNEIEVNYAENVDDTEPEPEPEPEPEQDPEPEPEPEPEPSEPEDVGEVTSSRDFSLAKFEVEYILQMSDLNPTLKIADGKLVATFKNDSKFPIEKYSLGFDVNGQSYTITSDSVTPVNSVSGPFGFVSINNLNLDQINLKTLKVIAQYEEGQKLNVDYSISPISSSYTITY